jgi:hypothetical protein
MVPSSGAEFLVSGDVNGDGIPDLLMKSAPNWIQVALGDGTGHFTFGDKIDVGEAVSAALADFDRDGNLDLVTGGTNSVKLFRGMGDGHFALKRMTNIGGANSADPIRTATSVVIADFNGDGKPDLAFPLFSAANIRIQFSDATGLEVASQRTLDPSGPIRANIAPRHVIALDFDNDGQPDLAITDAVGSSVQFINRYDYNSAGFVDVGSVGVGSQPFSLTKGDFNEDGFTDLAVRNGAGEIVLLRGGARTNFNALTLENWTTIKPLIAPNYLEAADFNNDGHDDLLVTGSSIQLLVGDGAGVFTTCTIAQLGGSPSAATISDFDRDGRLDFAVVNKATNEVIVFLNRSPGPAADLSIRAVEVTQTVQDFGNTVPLVAGKRTFARVHVTANVQAKGISAKLTATDANGTALAPTLLPQNPSGFIDVKKNPNRGAIDDSFWFELPPEWLKLPSLTLKAEVNTNRALSEGDYTNDVVTQAVAFTVGKTPKVRFVRYRQAEVTIDDDFFNRQFDDGLRSLLTELPVASIDATRTEFTDGDPIGAQGVVAGVAHLQAWHDIAEPNSRGVFYYGIGNFGGSIGNIGAPNDQNWFGVGNVAAVVHEFGHMLGLSHVMAVGDGCSAPNGTDPAYPYPDGKIGGPASQPDRFYGLNPINPQPATANLFQVIPNTTRDRMTYCPSQWLSDWSIRKILNYMQQNPNIALDGLRAILAAVSKPHNIFSLASAVVDGEDPITPPTDPHQVGDFLTVYGAVDLSQQKVTSLRMSREPVVGTIAVSQPGPYRVRLIDAAGQTLAVHAFTPVKLADSQNGGLIALTLPYVSATTRIVIETGAPARVLSSTNVSRTAPVVTSVTINQQTISPKRSTITWKGTDADGDTLRYAILYSSDNKQTWRPIAQGIKVARFVADSMAFEGTHGNTAGYIQVVAHDGVLTGRGESGAFKVENKSPRILMISPRGDATYEMNQFVILQALADDQEDGALADDALVWKSDRDGVLGKGRLVQARSLSKGDHIITVTATDSEGKTATARSVVHIGNRAPPLVVNCAQGTGDAMTLGGYSTNGAPFIVRSAAVKGMIGRGRSIYSADPAGHLARIKVVRRGGRDYLRTVVTGRLTENLLRLPACR